MQALIFDLDGTLCDTRVDLANAVNHARTRLGLAPLTVAEVTGYVGDGLAKLIARSFADRSELVEAALPLYREHYAAHLLDNSPLYDGVAEGLAALSALGAPMAVLTNKPEGYAREMLDHYGLSRYMKHIYGGDSFSTHKPDPEGVLAITRSYGIAPAETLLVGDNHTDLAAARAAGMPSVFCTYGFGRRNDEPCDATADSFADVVRLFTDRAG